MMVVHTARPVKTIKKAAQIAYTLQKAQPDPSDEYVSINCIWW